MNTQQSRAFDVLSMGRLAVDLYANEIGYELRQVKSFSVYAGGCPANIAVGTRRLGLRVAMSSRVGADGLSDGLVDFMKAEGISTEFIARDPNHLPGLAFLSILPPETFPLVYFRPDPADIYLSLADIQKAPIENSRVLLVAGTNFYRDPSRSTVLTAMERARRAGTTVVIDLDLRKTLWPDLTSFGVNVRSALPLADIIIGTEDEVTAAAGEPDINVAIPALLQCAEVALAVKRGQDGSEIYTPDGGVHRAKPFTVEVLNVLGAGDAWASGFIFGYLSGWDWAKSARFGNATGAIIVTRHACANDMPTYSDVIAFIESQGGF
jgi:5-dehydro-2-deoxygluconokinase